jgi:hypothetical protein
VRSEVQSELAHQSVVVLAGRQPQQRRQCQQPHGALLLRRVDRGAPGGSPMSHTASSQAASRSSSLCCAASPVTVNQTTLPSGPASLMPCSLASAATRAMPRPVTACSL